jgi:hypothetical protein
MLSVTFAVMSFITQSVGREGKNLPDDVKVIQWMLRRAHSFYGQSIFSSLQTASETGFLDNITLQMIADITARKTNQLKILQPAPVGQKSTPSNSFEFFNRPVIFPNDESYKYLLKCSLKPICLVCTSEGDVKADFNNDPLAIEALAGRMNFSSFKSQAEAKDKLECIGGSTFACNADARKKEWIIGFTPAQEARIKETLRNLDKMLCQEAFRKANLPTHAEVVKSRGVIIAHFNAFNTSLNTDLRKLGVTENHRVGIQQTVRDNFGIKDGYTFDPNAEGFDYLPAFTVLYDSAFHSKDYSFCEIFVHETIHRSGIRDHTACFLCRWIGKAKPHDLADYSPYNQILGGCGCS